MSLFTGPFDHSDENAKRLLTLAVTGYGSNKAAIGRFVAGIGVPEADITWDGSAYDVWADILEKAAPRDKLRSLVDAMLADENYALVRGELKELLRCADEEEKEERNEVRTGAGIADHARVTVIGRRPFVNRTTFRDNMESLVGPGGDHLVMVDGPRKSGRSYSWVLISHVTRKTGLQASLIDLSRFRGIQVRPGDVARMIAANLGWPPPGEDPTAQEETERWVLLGWLKNCVHGRRQVCLVFDGLDGDNVTTEAVKFIDDIATGAGNDELGDLRVVLLAFGRALQNPNVSPFVLSEPPLADIPLTEFTRYLRTVAAEGGNDMSEGQAVRLTERLFGSPSPDPVPVSLLADQAAALSKLVCKLRQVIDG